VSIAPSSAASLNRPTIKLKDQVTRLSATNPAGAAALAVENLAHFTADEALDLLRGLLRTNKPNTHVAERLAKHARRASVKHRVMNSVANQAAAKGLPSVAAILLSDPPAN
jgi:hypothetical protein